MKQQLRKLLKEAISSTQQQNDIASSTISEIHIEKPRNKEHGDFSSNIAIVLAKDMQTDARSLAKTIIKNLPRSDLITRSEIAGPGFINFFIDQQAQFNIIPTILQTGKKYGSSTFAEGQSILIEFVSANPTGPLHVGHGRSAAYGSVIANLLEVIGYKVDREYYVNDAGRQMDILALSIWLRYLQCCDIDIDIHFPQTLYQGSYIKDIANQLLNDKQRQLSYQIAPQRNHAEQSPETQIDQMISDAKATLGANTYQQIVDFGLRHIHAQIKQHLQEFGVTFDHWFSEQSLANTPLAQQYIDTLRKKDFAYMKNGALWFRSTAFGDEKDRVIIRENGQATYFASDIIYHMEKFSRGYNKLINIWGADHHGYIARIKAVLNALNANADKLEIRLVQFATLYRGKQKLPMSTRSGEFITLKELQDEVGIDAARFFYIMRKNEQHLNFDLELAKSKTNENPVYYIQYAHARICSLLKNIQQKGMSHDLQIGNDNLSLLAKPIEGTIITTLSTYPEIVHTAAINYEPHKLAYYLQKLATEFHSYYDSCPIIVDNEALRNARLNLISASKQVLENGLSILQISAPEHM